MTGYFFNNIRTGISISRGAPGGSSIRRTPRGDRGREYLPRRPGGTEASPDPEEDPPEISPGGRSSRHGRSSVPGRRSPGPSYGPEASGTVPNTPAGIKAEDGPPEASPEAILYITRERSNNYVKPI